MCQLTTHNNNGPNGHLFVGRSNLQIVNDIHISSISDVTRVSFVLSLISLRSEQAGGMFDNRFRYQWSWYAMTASYTPLDWRLLTPLSRDQASTRAWPRPSCGAVIPPWPLPTHAHSIRILPKICHHPRVIGNRLPQNGYPSSHMDYSHLTLLPTWFNINMLCYLVW